LEVEKQTNQARETAKQAATRPEGGYVSYVTMSI
jgi:hypothetical protein